MTAPARPLGPSVSPAVQRRRQLRLARVRVHGSLRAGLLPARGRRRRQRIDLCTAADTLTALGVRVVVVPPPVPWPRTNRFVLPDAYGWLADLALVTAALDRTPVGDGPLIVCPVTIQFRTSAGALAWEEVPLRIAEVAAAHGLVVEVRCLQAQHGAVES